MNKVNIAQLLKLTGKAKGFAPLFELVMNAMESILQRHIAEGIDKGHVAVILDGSFDEVQTISIQDDGLGFNKENYARFGCLLDNSKGFANKGAGRLQVLQLFKRFDVQSIYQTGGIFYRRSFTSGQEYLTHNHNCGRVTGQDIGSMVVLDLDNFTGSRKEKNAWEQLTAEDLSHVLSQHFLLFFELVYRHYPDLSMSVVVKQECNEESHPVRTNIRADKSGGLQWEAEEFIGFDDDGFPIFRDTGRTEILHYAHFILDKSLQKENGVWLCGAGKRLMRLPINSLQRADIVEEDGNETRYVTLIYGQGLDDKRHVNGSSLVLTKRDDVVDRFMAGDMFMEQEELYLQDRLMDTIAELTRELYEVPYLIRLKQRTELKDMADRYELNIDKHCKKLPLQANWQSILNALLLDSQEAFGQMFAHLEGARRRLLEDDALSGQQCNDWQDRIWHIMNENQKRYSCIQSQGRDILEQFERIDLPDEQADSEAEQISVTLRNEQGAEMPLL